YVRENRAYLNERIIDVPWTNKELSVKWERFRSKLLPGQEETWTAVVTGADAKPAAAELVAALYDASLDQFSPHHWQQRFNIFRREFNRVNTTFHNAAAPFTHVAGYWSVGSRSVDWRYRTFSEDLGGWRYRGDEETIVLLPFSVRAPAESRGYLAASSLAGSRAKGAVLRDEASAIALAAPNPEAVASREEPVVTPDLNQVTARTNLNETAFFLPHLLSDADGVVRMQFTMPEALTEWKFLGFAHDPKLRSGSLTAKTVTAKDLMVEPNPPRFVREGDAIEFTVKVSNQTEQPQTGRVRLTFADAATLQPVDDALGNRITEQNFEIPARQSRSYSWRLEVPDGMPFLTYKAVGATAQASDGEEGFLPVLSRRILVTESLPLPIRGKSTKEFTFTKLLESAQSDTLRHQSLTVQMVSQPAWYAVMALPYLMEFPHECSEQLFNRLYANTLAQHIAGSDPKIRRIFDLWKNTPALDSPLEKNQDLKSVMIEETPWLRQATSESQNRRNVGLLFDDNRLNGESSRTLNQLAERQLADGLWSWFPGGRPSEYISLYIATGFGRLRQLGADIDVAPALRSLAALDAWMERRHREILKRDHPEQYVPGSLEAFHLYGRSFFLKDRPVAREHQAAWDFFVGQARKYWTRIGSRQSEAHLALALHRLGDTTHPAAIMKSLKERSVSDPELGMFWRDQELSWWWFHAPIETQAMMIEAFAEV
ncbi:MAG TPA: alpha-2-macroglobulin family protein, partial [Lacunisphaera sp.]|nr:alpha-2-macroglobulin family protein [Lacunisphaera sp.]